MKYTSINEIFCQSTKLKCGSLPIQNVLYNTVGWEPWSFGYHRSWDRSPVLDVIIAASLFKHLGYMTIRYHTTSHVKCKV